MEEERLIERIKALLNKTTENGATPEEAMSAAEKARQLMDKHNLTVTIEDIKKDEVADKYISLGDRKDNILDIGDTVALFCDCVFFMVRPYHANFLGMKNDVEMAITLFVSLIRTRDATMNDWLKTEEGRLAYSTNSLEYLKDDYTLGYNARIKQRLMGIIQSRQQKHAAAHSRSLVPAKKGMIEGFLKEHNVQVDIEQQFERLRNPNRAAVAGGIQGGNQAELGNSLDKKDA